MSKNTTEKTRVQAIPKIDIPHYAMVNYMRMGSRHAEVVYMKSKPKQAIKKLSKNTYEVLRTGEVKEYQPHNGKQINIIKKSMRRLEQLIKANFDTVGNATNALFITLTYAGADMTDTDRLYSDFDDFFRKLKRAHKDHKLDYIVVAEPHASGGWHMHMLLKSNQPVLYIDNKRLTEYQLDPTDPEKKKLYIDPETGQPVIIGGLWAHGSTTCVRLKSDDCGAYYTAYFSNAETTIPGDDEHEQQFEVKDGVEVPIEPDPNAEYAFAADEETGKRKRFQKGDRLRFYPKHMKFYRCSRGIIRPDAKQMAYSEVPKDLGTPKRISTYEISKDFKHYDKDTVSLKQETKTINVIQREVFKNSE